nr:hypothetical protein [Rhizobium etli]
MTTGLPGSRSFWQDIIVRKWYSSLSPMRAHLSSLFCGTQAQWC